MSTAPITEIIEMTVLNFYDFNDSGRQYTSEEICKNNMPIVLEGFSKKNKTKDDESTRIKKVEDSGFVRSIEFISDSEFSDCDGSPQNWIESCKEGLLVTLYRKPDNKELLKNYLLKIIDEIKSLSLPANKILEGKRVFNFVLFRNIDCFRFSEIISVKDRSAKIMRRGCFLLQELWKFAAKELLVKKEPCCLIAERGYVKDHRNYELFFKSIGQSEFCYCSGKWTDDEMIIKKL